MKSIRMFGKVASALFIAAALAACSGSDTQEADDAAAAAAAAGGRTGQEASALELQRLEEAAAAVGNVFYFEYDSSSLTPEAVQALNAHIALLQQTNRSVRLEGHTDERGTREYNMALGERRANSVRDYMTANGISGMRIESVSYGEERPIGYGSGESNYAQNRRVELK